MKTKLVRDIPIGVLLIVLSLWCVATIQYLSGWPNIIPLLGILFLANFGYRLLSVGLDVIIGVQIADKND
jgi:hypothetical protein